ncbi:MAG: hypothetical protein K0S61_2253 [Anaerocolumna sp.]|jgi:hypothetical protein|nr:hypothetical protein [Anaerocolumna sp.]
MLTEEMISKKKSIGNVIKTDDLDKKILEIVGDYTKSVDIEKENIFRYY